jgi:crossover junction endodeoxyribonuclease RuvC
MRIIGIDPGIGRTGWGVVDTSNAKMQVVDYNCLETKAGGELPERIALVYQGITHLFEEYRPDVVAIEELFFNVNVKTALIVGQARGVILLAAAQSNLPVFVYTPSEVKVAVTGYGKAEKQQVGQMVKMLLRLKTLPKLDDTTDALAIAITHAFSQKLRKHIAS